MTSAPPTRAPHSSSSESLPPSPPAIQRDPEPSTEMLAIVQDPPLTDQDPQATDIEVPLAVSTEAATDPSHEDTKIQDHASKDTTIQDSAS